MKKTIIISVLFILFYSCEKESTNSPLTHKKPNNIPTEFQGVWSGFFTGDDTGSWTALISEEGVVTGSLKSGSGYGDEINGTVENNGAFTAGTVSTGSTFVGSLNEGIANGQWSNSSLNISGSWQGTKQ
ncbi:MAG: hypothetical protein CMD04_01215 [Flavobacteriales bacterium]|nr:hypothetical protein [Flavobacteriales bacterium]